MLYLLSQVLTTTKILRICCCYYFYYHGRDFINQGTNKCGQSVALWMLAAQLEVRQGQLVKARSLLEKARLRNPKNQLLWLESIRLENTTENKKLAATRLAQALQECPNSGLLWSEAILMEPRQQRKAKSVDAIKSWCTFSNVSSTMIVHRKDKRTLTFEICFFFLTVRTTPLSSVRLLGCFTKTANSKRPARGLTARAR